MKRTLILIVLMVASCAAANRTLAVLQTHTSAGSLVDTTSPQVTLPGTIYVSQQGAIFAIKGTSVRRLPLPAGGAWIQPRALPDGSLLVVRRFDEYSDLYHVSASGRVLSAMTSDDQSTGNRTLQLDHWILWPAVSPDGTTVFFATDSPKPAPRQSFEVDFSLWSAPVGGPITIGDNGVNGGTRWSVPDAYTGGDIEPIPLPDGDVLYASYANTGKGQVQSVLGLQTGPRSRMVSLTSPGAELRHPGGRGRRRDRGDDLQQRRSVRRPRGCDARGFDAQRAARAGRELPVQLAVVVVERRQSPLHGCIRPGRQLRAVVHRGSDEPASPSRATCHRYQRRPRCDVGRGLGERVAVQADGCVRS